MEFETLNEVIYDRFNRKLQNGLANAQTAIRRLEEEGKIARDFVAPIGNRTNGPKTVEFSANGHLRMTLMTGRELTQLNLHPHAISQVGDRFGIPSKYLRELANGDEWSRQLSAYILNEHSANIKPTRMLIRSVGDTVRGVLSDSYRRLDSHEIITAFASEVQQQGAVICDGYMDDTKLWMEVLHPELISIPTEANGNVMVAMGCSISTSDYGDGALYLRTFLMQAVCLNGMCTQSVLQQRHLGAKLDDNPALSERTYKLDTATTCSAVKDYTRMLLQPQTFLKHVERIKSSAKDPIDISRELTLLSKGKLNQDECAGVQEILMRNKREDGLQGESTLWKLTQAISAYGREIDPRRSRELSELAGELLVR